MPLNICEAPDRCRTKNGVAPSVPSVAAKKPCSLFMLAFPQSLTPHLILDVSTEVGIKGGGFNMT